MKIKELLNQKDKWTKNAFARNIDGQIATTFDENAVSWCLTGAIAKCYWNQDPVKISLKILKQIRLLGYLTVSSYNDDPIRKFEDIKKLVNKLNI